jgi:hypothetical protein
MIGDVGIEGENPPTLKIRWTEGENGRIWERGTESYLEGYTQALELVLLW